LSLRTDHLGATAFVDEQWLNGHRPAADEKPDHSVTPDQSIGAPVKTFLKYAVLAVICLSVGAAMAGGNSDSKSVEKTEAKADTSNTVAPGDKPNSDAADSQTTVETEPPAEPEPEPEPVVADPNGEYDLNCDYLLKFDESLNGNNDHRFVGGGTLENTGNIGIRVRVTYKWKLLGQGPLTVKKTYKVRRNETRDIAVNIPATDDQIDAHQSADGDCTAKATIVGTFGEAV